MLEALCFDLNTRAECANIRAESLVPLAGPCMLIVTYGEQDIHPPWGKRAEAGVEADNSEEETRCAVRAGNGSSVDSTPPWQSG